MLQQSLTGRPRCECHECTQARWNMSFQHQQMGGALGKSPNVGITQTPGVGIGQTLQSGDVSKAYQQQQVTSHS